MASLATLTINDGLSTPVSRDFLVTNVDNRVITYQDKDHPRAATPEGRPTITLGNRPVNGTGNYKATLRVKVPVLDTWTEGGNQLIGTALANVDIVLPSNVSSEAVVNDVYAFLINALQDPQVSDTIKSQVLPY